jgi:adenosylhomocysteinase
VFSVARSPLKDPEDYLVGQSITFSAEALIRSRGDILHGRRAAVIGYGKLGRSIAAMLHAKHVGVTVYDSDPLSLLAGVSTEPGLHELDHTERSRIASLWLHYFEGRSDVSHA